MKSKTKTCFAIVAAGALMALSASALAQDGQSSAVKLTDTELDEITAGQGATSQLVIFNPGKGPGEVKTNNNHVTCINCDPLDVGSAFGVMQVTTPKGKIIVSPIGKMPALPQF